MKALAAGVVVVLAALAAAGTARATHGPPPWTGGAATTSPLEARLARISTEIGDRPALGHCPAPDEWDALGVELDFDPGSVYGLVPGTATGPANFALYNPVVCYLLDEFLARPENVGQKSCQVGTRAETQMQTRTVYRTQRYRATARRRVKVRGKWVTKRVQVWKTRRVAVKVSQQAQVEVPVYEKCRNWDLTVESIETVAHESTHIGGVGDEPAAECLGLQLTALTARRFGASLAFALEIGRDFVPLYAAFVAATPRLPDGQLLRRRPARPLADAGGLAEPGHAVAGARVVARRTARAAFDIGGSEHGVRARARQPAARARHAALTAGGHALRRAASESRRRRARRPGSAAPGTRPDA